MNPTSDAADVFAAGLNFSPSQAADYARLSVSFLAKLRMAENRHRGPRFLKIGKAVIYRKADLDAWLASHLVEAA